MRQGYKALLRSVAVTSICAMVAGVLGACDPTGGQPAQTAAESPAAPATGETVAEAVSDRPIMGDHVQFDPNQLMNNGEPITLKYWTWNTGDPVIPLAEEFHELYPNVTIEIVNQPWDDYWTALPLALQSPDGPALFNIHNSQDALIRQFLAPYDIPVADLEADYLGVESHVVDGEVGYIDSLMMTGNIFYNKDMWEAAGLTDADIPQTWDQFRDVAQRLTIRDGDALRQAGFNFNGDISGLWQGLNYQNGTLLFKEDGTTPNFDNPTTVQNWQFLTDLYNVDHVGDANFGTDSTMSFGNGQSAMVYKWGWFNNELNTNYPDINFGVFATPTPTTDTPFAYDRYNGESTPGINRNQSPEQQAVAQQFIRFILASDDYFRAGAEAMGAFPSKKSLSDDPQILANPVLAAMAPRINRLIWPGPFPATVETTATQTMEDIQFNNVPLADAISQGQARMEADMANSGFTSREPLYEFISEASH